MEITRKPIADLVPDPLNPRSHPEVNLDAIVGSLARFGQAEPLVVQRGRNRMVGGHAQSCWRA